MEEITKNNLYQYCVSKEVVLSEDKENYIHRHSFRFPWLKGEKTVTGEIIVKQKLLKKIPKRFIREIMTSKIIEEYNAKSI